MATEAKKLRFFLAFALLLFAAASLNATYCAENLNTANTVYTMDGNCAANGTNGLNITATNITLNCAGFNITGNNSTGTWGVFSNQDYTTVRNCNIHNFNIGVGIGTTSAGFGDNSTIENNNISGSHTNSAIAWYGAPMISLNNVQHCNVSNNTLFPNGGTNSEGIFQIGSYNQIINNSITATSAAVSMMLQVVQYSNITRNRINSDLSSALSVNMGQLAINNVFANNNISAQSGAGTTINPLYMWSSANHNLVENNTIATNRSVAILVTNSLNNTFRNNTITALTGGALSFTTNAHNNTVANNTITITTGVGISATSSSGLQIVNNTAICSGACSAAFTDGLAGGLTNSNILGNNFTATAGTAAIWFRATTADNNNTISNNYLRGGAYSMILYRSNQNTVVSNNIMVAGTTYITYETTGIPLNITFRNNTLIALWIDGFNHTIEGNYIHSQAQFGGVYTNTGPTGGILFANNTINATTLISLVLNDRTPAHSIQNSTFINNTLKATTALGLLYIGQNATNNTFYWNNFTDTSGYYVNDTNGSNFYNTSTEGNVWFNVMNDSVKIYGSVFSSGYPSLYIGSSGSGYPYSNNTSLGKIFGNMSDWGALTKNFTLPNVRHHPNGGFGNSSTVMTTTNSAYSQILGFSFNVSNTTPYFAYATITVSNSHPVQDVVGQWRVLLNGEELGNTTRTILAGTTGSVVISSKPLTTNTTAMNVSVEHRRAGGSGNVVSAQTRAVIYGMRDHNNLELLDYASFNISASTASTSYANLSSGTFTTTYRGTAVLLWDIDINKTTSNMSFYQFRFRDGAFTNCGEVLRYVSDGGFGSTGGVCVIQNISIGAHPIELWGYNPEGASTFRGVVHAYIYGEADANSAIQGRSNNQTLLANLSTSSATLFNIANVSVETNVTYQAIIGMAGISANSTAATTSTFMLRLINSSDGAEIGNSTQETRTLSTGLVGVKIIQFRWGNLLPGNYTVQLYANTSAGTLTLVGGSLAALQRQTQDVYFPVTCNGTMAYYDMIPDNTIIHLTSSPTSLVLKFNGTLEPQSCFANYTAFLYDANRTLFGIASSNDNSITNLTISGIGFDTVSNYPFYANVSMYDLNGNLTSTDTRMYWFVLRNITAPPNNSYALSSWIVKNNGSVPGFSFQQGDNLTVYALFKSNDSAADPDTNYSSVTLFLGNGTIFIPLAAMNRTSTGLYSYDFVVGASDEKTSYFAFTQGRINGTYLAATVWYRISDPQAIPSVSGPVWPETGPFGTQSLQTIFLPAKGWLERAQEWIGGKSLFFTFQVFHWLIAIGLLLFFALVSVAFYYHQGRERLYLLPALFAVIGMAFVAWRYSGWLT